MKVRTVQLVQWLNIWIVAYNFWEIFHRQEQFVSAKVILNYC